MQDITSYVQKDPSISDSKKNSQESLALDPELVTTSFLESPAIYTKAIFDTVINEIGNKSYYNVLIDSEQLIDALNRIRYDFVTVKSAWDLYCIQHEKYEPVIRSFQPKEKFVDIIQIIKQKNKSRSEDIVLQA